MKKDMDLLRGEINQLDEQLVHLLNKRAELALQIGRLKATGGAKVYDPARERAIIERIGALNDGPLSKGALEEIFAAVITVCREIQNH